MERQPYPREYNNKVETLPTAQATYAIEPYLVIIGKWYYVGENERVCLDIFLLEQKRQLCPQMALDYPVCFVHKFPE